MGAGEVHAGGPAQVAARNTAAMRSVIRRARVRMIGAEARWWFMVCYFTTAGGFHLIRERRLTSEEAQSLEQRVRAVLDLIRPAIRADGGDLEFVGITDDGVVQIRLLGACIGCPSSEMTLRTGIEHNLRQHVPAVKGVQAVP